MNIIRSLQKQPKPLALLLGIILVLLLGAIDSKIPPNISFSPFYLIPVSLTAWLAGEVAGLLISLASAVTWYLVNPAENTAGYFAIPVWNAFMRFIFFANATYLIGEIRYSQDRERKLARTDALTNLSNRRAFFELAGMEIARAKRYRTPLTVAYIDADNFKHFNEDFGFRTGDDLLKLIAKTILTNLRSTDLIARLGGDEFAILLPETAYDPAQIAISRVQNALLEAVIDLKWPVTFSIGAVTFIQPPTSVEEMIERADSLMYFAKQNGKNMVKHERFTE
ncbi:GGDEF domain-containing protein [Kamptonema formosum]|uniref:GGDEF domain-containing protein n=1 Tax=Kamptonema formosum TaxID=331992 RepID=UPI000348101B|nr:GGDEF domain-containing protein [Oscillatoria sp. PCC 10802]